MIKNWVEKNLVDTESPRQHGKAPVGAKSGYWRYRIGNYRILADIRDDELVIISFK